nr:DUF308 domain-containing protein [Aureimonas altamirensis]
MRDGVKILEADLPRSSWGWLVALGVLLLFLGLAALAHLALATVASLFLIGALMVAGGLAHIVVSFGSRTGGRGLLWFAAGILYILAGLAVFTNPVLASTVLTLLIAVLLTASGAVRIWFGVSARPEHGWGWLVAGGLVTLLLGLVIALGWPVNSLWVIGAFLAADLMVQGGACLALGLYLRAR